MTEQKKLNFVFFGTPEVARDTLEILKQNDYLPSLIITSIDKPKGRKMILSPSPVKTWAIENNIRCLQPEDLKNVDWATIFMTSSQSDEPRKAIFQQKNMRENKNSCPIEISIVVAYGKIIPEDILNYPKLGSINIHYSLLPKYRGASPVESAILNGDKETGVTIQKMAYKLDSGPIIDQEKTKIDENETTPELKERLTKLGAEMLVKLLNKKKWETIEQKESEATFCKKIKKEDGLIDLNEKAENNFNKFRAYITWPRTYLFENGKRIIITEATLENNKFNIKKIIPEGGKEKEYKI